MRRQLALLLGTIVLASAVTAQASEGDQPAANDRCAASAAALPSARPDARVLYSTEPPGRLSPAVLAALKAPTEGGWEPKAPPRRAFDAAAGAVQISAMTCANVRALAGERGELLSEAAARAKLQATPITGATIYLHRVSLAALSADHRQAIVAIVSSSNQLAGGGSLVFLEKEGGRWREVGRRVVTIG